MLLLLSCGVRDDGSPGAVNAQRHHARRLFERGYLERSQQEAHRARLQYAIADPSAADEFRILEAEAMLFRGFYPEALRLVSPGQSIRRNAQESVRGLAIEAVALAREQQQHLAHQKLAQAESICRRADNAACGDVLRASGILAIEDGKPFEARRFFLETVAFARVHRDDWLQASASLNLGWTELHTGHFDEALDWSRAARLDADRLGAEDLAQAASGNLGWAYYQLGDREKALGEFLEAQTSATALGDPGSELEWVSAAGYVYRDTGDLTRATDSYRQAYKLARQIDSKDDIVNALEDLAQVSIDAGKPDEAEAYINQLAPMELDGGGRLSANVVLTQGMIAAARRQNTNAELFLRSVQSDPANPTTTRLGAGEQLALLFEAEGNQQAAEQMYKATLSAFDSAQAQLRSEESQIPFVANAERIYDDYIHLLLHQGRVEEALAVADQSRARTLARALGVEAGKSPGRSVLFNPRQIARKTGSTLLFYWVGKRQSCLWAITPAQVALFRLPSRPDIEARIARYRRVVLEAEDPLEAADPDGQALYRSLVAPAANLFRANGQVMILADGTLSQLNFETLLVPIPSPADTHAARPPGLNRAPGLHYFIEDATLVSAQSLAMLAAARPETPAPHTLLLLGNPDSPSEDFPSLPFFARESDRIQAHFDSRAVAAFTRRQATPASYLASNPARYAYIHFVSHAVSSQTDPLDSAIILSRPSLDSGGDSFKLYARDIMRHPISARLVTISACNGSGTRSYAGEGLVGLSWAFLHAGAHSVIGALWEASDDSSPPLMDQLYQGIEESHPPAAALRQAKLSLLHSGSRFRSPFYWAPFQLYTSR